MTTSGKPAKKEKLEKKMNEIRTSHGVRLRDFGIFDG
jgi:hypothetical protein